MTLIDVNRSLETEDLCRELLKRLRWPFGVRCLRCKSHAVFELATQKKFECSECHYQFSITTQTIFHDTHLPLETWFLAVLLLLEARKRMTAKQVRRTLRVSYKTVWYLCHRIRRAIARADRPMLHRTVQMQDTYVRGKTRGKRRPATLGDDEIRFLTERSENRSLRLFRPRRADQPRVGWPYRRCGKRFRFWCSAWSVDQCGGGTGSWPGVRTRVCGTASSSERPLPLFQ